MDGSELNFRRGLFFAGTVDDRSKDFVRAQAQDLGFLKHDQRISDYRADIDTYNSLANESDRLQGGDAQICVRSVVHKAEQGLDQLGPLALGQFDSSDSGHGLGCKVSRLDIRGAKGHERILLDLMFGIAGQVEPSAGHVCLAVDLLWRSDACER